MRAVLAEGGRCVVKSVAVPALGRRECLVKVVGTAVNRADTLQRKGLYPTPPGASNVLGLEFAGEVSQLDKDCELGFQVGDRVMGIVGGGGYAEFVNVHETHLIRVPEEMSWDEAAAIPEVWLTAFQLLRFVGDSSDWKAVSGGYHVLIHAGGSGVGTSAVQLTKHFGGVPIVTAGSDDKIKCCMNLGCKGGVNYKTTPNWVDEVMRLTDGKGVNLILDCVGGTYWDMNAQVIAVDGKWVVYGLMGGAEVNGNLLATLLRKRATIVGTTLRSRDVEYKARLTQQFVSECIGLFGKGGKFVPVVDRVMANGLDDAQEAHEIVETNTTNGKVILRIVQ